MQTISPSYKFINYSDQHLKSFATSMAFMLLEVRHPDWTYAHFSTLNSIKQLNGISRMWRSFSLLDTCSFYNRHSHSLSTWGFQTNWIHTLLKGSLLGIEYTITKQTWAVVSSSLQTCCRCPATKAFWVTARNPALITITANIYIHFIQRDFK